MQKNFREMFRTLVNSCLRVGTSSLARQSHVVSHGYNLCKPQFARCFSTVLLQNPIGTGNEASSLLSNNSWNNPPRLPALTPLLLQQQSRTVVKFSLGKGKRRTVRSVPARFMRLDWGIWIRRMAGAHKKLWKKNNKIRRRLERHVLINSTRSYMLDKMVTKYWRTPKYWVDDPYAPYHKREEFPFTRQNPRPLPPGVTFPLDKEL